MNDFFSTLLERLSQGVPGSATEAEAVFSCRLSRLLFLGPSRSQAPPGNARAVRLCLCKSGRRQAEPARQGVPGQSPGTRVERLAQGVPGSATILVAQQRGRDAHAPRSR
jgi:hypothetical protein